MQRVMLRRFVGIYFIMPELNKSKRLWRRFFPIIFLSFIFCHTAWASPVLNMRITNVRGNQFTVSWTTADNVEADVRYGSSILDTDTWSSASDYRGSVSDDVHHVTISDLTPEQTVYFEIISGTTTDNNGGAYYSINPGPAITPPPGSCQPAGKVFKDTGKTNPAYATIVYVTIKGDPDSATESVMVTTGTSGYWFLELSNFRTADYSALYNADIESVCGTQEILVEAQAGNNGTAQMTTFSQDYLENGLLTALILVPAATLSTTATDPTNESPIPVTVTFSEQVTGFTIDDLVVGNGTAADFTETATGQVWSVNITPTTDGEVTVDIGAGAALDADGNASTAADQLTLTYDGTSPLVTLSTTVSSPVNASPIPVTVTFSEKVTGFTIDDLVVGNGTAADFTQNTAGQEWSVNITPAADGEVTVDIGAGAALDAAGNSSTAAGQLSLTYDAASPSVTLSTTATDPTNESPIPVTVTFSEKVTGFTIDDLVVGNGTAADFTQNTAGQVWTVNITPAADGEVTVDIGAGAALDAVGNACTAAVQLSRTYDSTMDTVDTDTDNDGLSDDWEEANGTDPDNPDTDGDGLFDGDEIDAGEDPATYSGPGIAQPVSPMGGDVAELPVQLLVAYPESADPDMHGSTRWQIALDSDFSTVILDLSPEEHLLLLRVPEQVLTAETACFWRARFVGTNGYERAWSDAAVFTTGSAAFEDNNANGIPDDQEAGDDETIDIAPETGENWDETLQSISILGDYGTPIVSSLQLQSDTDLEYFGHTAAADLQDEDANTCPGDLIMGVFTFRLRVAEAGATTAVRLCFSPSFLDDSTLYYKFDTVSGWIDYSDAVSTGDDPACITVEITDGGFWDADGVANGIIVDPLGAATQKVEDDGQDAGNSGCFINSLINF